MTHNMNISMGDFAFLLTHAVRDIAPRDQARFDRLSSQYQEEATRLGARAALAEKYPNVPFFSEKTSRVVRPTLAERQTRNTAEVLGISERIAEYLKEPTHYAVVIENSYAEPITVTDDKAVAFEAARIFNLAGSMHPDGQGHTAEVYAYGPGATKGTIVTR